MNKTFTILCVLSILFNCLYAQTNITIARQATIGGNNDDYPSITLLEPNGDYIIGGGSASTISGDKTEDSFGYSDYWVLKLSPNLDIEWQKTIGGNGFDRIFDIINLNEEKFLCLGLSGSPISGNKTVPTFGVSDFWLVGIDSLQNITWQMDYGGFEDDEPSSICKLNNGTIILGGTSQSDSSGTKTENTRGLSDYWITCIDSTGNYLWDKTYGGSSAEMLTDIQIFDNNSFLIAGWSSSPASGEKSQNSFGSNDIWLILVNSNNGDIIWDKTIGGSEDDSHPKIRVKNNFIYVVSTTSSDISGVKTSALIGVRDFWYLKLDSNGNIIIDKTLGGSLDEYVRTIEILDNNSILFGGNSNSNISGNKSEDSRGEYDYWIIVTDSVGNYLWDKTIGGAGFENLDCVTELDNHNILLTGSSKSGISGDKTEGSKGGADFWLVELAINLNIDKPNTKIIQLFPNPAKETINLQFESTMLEMKINIYNLLGEIFFSKDIINQSDYSLNISDYEPGTYILQAIAGEEVYSEKFVIMR